MINTSHLKLAIYTILAMLLATYSYGQQTAPVDTGTLHQLVTKKITMDKDNDFKDRYTIQIFYGEIQGAQRIKTKYNSLGLSWTASMEYEEPNHKIWVGKYRSRLEADIALIEIKKSFPNAFVLRP